MLPQGFGFCRRSVGRTLAFRREDACQSGSKLVRWFPPWGRYKKNLALCAWPELADSARCADRLRGGTQGPS